MGKMKKTRHNLTKKERRFVEIEEIGSISTYSIADGKNLPVLILNTDGREDIKLAIDNHAMVESGDVSTAWARRNRADYENIQLLIKMIRPSDCKFVLNFEIEKNWPAVDMIVQNGGCYIQSSVYGTKLSKNINAPKVLIEVLSKDFHKEWDKLYHIGVTNMFKRKKMKPKKAGEMADSFIKEMRNLNYSIGRRP